ncbi:hypothetical protein FJT64_023664 [Amphibalanus amphitrite]|uniref:Uncharacterized protein n=1 Tax=Amphibalanus amphitrite TaxID=1232801 RepID=A0A6A4WGZ9_AMPAM|nr:uncharacterized protein LOC122372467 [Amphibalanus amphitrite]KAF0304489.1 hypothetical protein FJT64_023664 [Amphibalanus amphitrite]
MAEGGRSPPPRPPTARGYHRLVEAEEEYLAAVAAGSPRPEYWLEQATAWEDECRRSPGLEQLLQPPDSPVCAGRRRLGPAVPTVSSRVTGDADSQRASDAGERPAGEQPPDQPRWKVDIQVRDPRLEDVGCCNFCLGTCLNPYPINFEIITMSDSPMLCANYMVVRRWDEDFIKLYNSLRDQFAFNGPLISALNTHRPRRLTQLSEDAVTLQCGLHKKLLKWIMSNNAFYSSHDLHAFIGCKADTCPSQHTESVKKFPQYPRGTRRRRSGQHED